MMTNANACQKPADNSRRLRESQMTATNCVCIKLTYEAKYNSPLITQQTPCLVQRRTVFSDFEEVRLTRESVAQGRA